MTQSKKDLIFLPEVPPDLEHAPMVREEALEWLEYQLPGSLSFTTGEVLRMAGEGNRRYLISRLREQGIGNETLFSLPDTADALAVLFLRSRGAKFQKAVDAVLGQRDASRNPEPRYGGIWNRLLVTALERLRRRVPPRLLGSAISALLRDPKDQFNCLIIVKRHGQDSLPLTSDGPTAVSHDYVHRTILERPSPSCSVVTPSMEMLFLGSDQLPARSEVTSRHFVGLHLSTGRENYELLLGSMHPAKVSWDASILVFVGKILDIVFPLFEEFHRTQSVARSEASIQPDPGSADDLQVWLLTQFLGTIYQGSLCEIIETFQGSYEAKALASSAAKPWEPSLWDPPKGTEMLSGYASVTGVPLVVDAIEYPLSLVVKSVEPEIRFLRSRAPNGEVPAGYSAMALPFMSSSGDSIGSLYMLMPQIDGSSKDAEVRILTIFSLIVGEVIERQRAARHSADVYANIATLTIPDQQEFRGQLLNLLRRKAEELAGNDHLQQDSRLPFLLLSAHRPDPDVLDPAVADRLKDWLVQTLHYLDWRSFLRSHLSDAAEDYSADSFIGELPGAGMLIALDKLVSKDQLDRIRGAFPSRLNRISPTNSPVKLVAWVLDVPAPRILEAAEGGNLQSLADEVERWAFDVASVVDDVAQSTFFAHEQGDWNLALRQVRKALQKESARSNSYLRRLAADCSFSLGDWPSAMKYAREAVSLSRRDLGSGLTRSLCQEGDAHLCLGDPIAAWDLYMEAAAESPNHPLPPYYRGQGTLLLAKLLQVYEDELLRGGESDAVETARLDKIIGILCEGAMEDLTAAADLLDRWGLIPESYQYRNFHLVPTLMGQGACYLLSRSPGPAASRIQGARRSFPKDDLFYREFIFAKCWEQGLHRSYGTMLLGDKWQSLQQRLEAAFGDQSG